MTLYDLNRAGDTPIATLKVSDIVPKNWHKFPPAVLPSNPEFVPVKAYQGGAWGDDQSQSTANVAYTSNSPAPENPTYAPTTQQAKATALGTTIVQDMGRARGILTPQDPYPVAGDPAPAAPVISSLAPATAVAGSPAGTVVITGTGFTQWSSVKIGQVYTPYYRYLSPTKMLLLPDALRSVPGTVTVIVTDHGVDSNASNFVFT